MGGNEGSQRGLGGDTGIESRVGAHIKANQNTADTDRGNQESGDQSRAQRRGTEALGQESSVRMQNPAQGVSHGPWARSRFPALWGPRRTYKAEQQALGIYQALHVANYLP